MAGKRYTDAIKNFDRDQIFPLSEAVDMVKKMATAKFDETVELHMRLGIDPRHSEQQIRSTVLLPHGLGKTVRVLVFAEGEDALRRHDEDLRPQPGDPEPADYVGTAGVLGDCRYHRRRPEGPGDAPRAS
jgi:hypothetical protein